MIEQEFEIASEPLFAAGDVDVVEWSFDMGWGRPLTPWLSGILKSYSESNRLLGHGVSYSALDASETDRQQRWLDQLRNELHCHRYVHLSEHFGFMGGGNFHLSAPLPVPRTPCSVAIGQQRLTELAQVAGVPVGLENLAFAFHLQDVQEQGAFLEDLLSAVDGFLLLDLHNLYCQSCNFNIDLLELVRSYPLQRVRELHFSGGSWGEHPQGSGNRIRRDTHNDRVPEVLFEVLPKVLGLCPNVEFLILERLGDTLGMDSREHDRFREDFRRLKHLVEEAASHG